MTVPNRNLDFPIAYPKQTLTGDTHYPAGFLIVERIGVLGQSRGRYGVNIDFGDPDAITSTDMALHLQSSGDLEILHKGVVYNPQQANHLMRAIFQSKRNGKLRLDHLKDTILEL